MAIYYNKVYLTDVSHKNIEQLRLWRNTPEIKHITREYREINEEMQQQWFDTHAYSDNTQIHFEIHSTETNGLLGHCSLTNINWVYRSAEFGIYLGEQQQQHKGYGGDALKALIRHGFEDLNMHKMWGETFSFNQKALSAFYKIGFTEECVLRRAKFINGQYHDIIVISILEDEWREKYGE